jgi:hypothetical protein
MKNKKNVLALIMLFAFLVVPSCAFGAAAFSYTPMEEIPGFGKPTDFVSYIVAIYKFGIGAIGVCAMLMIIIGGYMYIASAGNAATMGKAKGVIQDALIGLIMAFASWVLLYAINPDLVSFVSLDQALDQAAKTYDGKYPGITQDMPANCNASQWQEIFNDLGGGDKSKKCVIQAIAAKESSCRKVPPRTQGGRDCSVAQIYATANCGTTCEDLEQNPKKALQCAYGYMNNMSGSWRTSPDDQKIRDMYAGYNGGPVALQNSASCTGLTNDYGNSFKKWDCKKDCGGYCNVPGVTSVFLSLYKQCMASS